MWTRGEGVQNPENFADVLYEWSLRLHHNKILLATTELNSTPERNRTRRSPGRLMQPLPKVHALQSSSAAASKRWFIFPILFTKR